MKVKKIVFLWKQFIAIVLPTKIACSTPEGWNFEFIASQIIDFCPGKGNSFMIHFRISYIGTNVDSCIVISNIVNIR